MEKTGLRTYCALDACWYQETIASNTQEAKYLSPSKKFTTVPLTESNVIWKHLDVINMDS